MLVAVRVLTHAVVGLVHIQIRIVT